MSDTTRILSAGRTDDPRELSTESLHALDDQVFKSDVMLHIRVSPEFGANFEPFYWVEDTKRRQAADAESRDCDCRICDGEGNPITQAAMRQLCTMLNACDATQHESRWRLTTQGDTNG